jgi:hypothetical protein
MSKLDRRPPCRRSPLWRVPKSKAARLELGFDFSGLEDAPSCRKSLRMIIEPENLVIPSTRLNGHRAREHAPRAQSHVSKRILTIFSNQEANGFTSSASHDPQLECEKAGASPATQRAAPASPGQKRKLREFFATFSGRCPIRFVRILQSDPCPQPKSGYLIARIDRGIRLTKPNEKTASRWRAPTITIDLDRFRDLRVWASSLLIAG